MAGVPERPEVAGFLYIMEGSQKGEIVKLYSGRNTIGTSTECSIVLQDSEVSAKHASLRYEENTCQLRDLDSQNGTFVNGKEIVRAELQENDIISVGNTKLKLKTL